MLSAQRELTHAEGQSNSTCVGGQNLNFGANFIFLFLRLVTYFFPCSFLFNRYSDG